MFIIIFPFFRIFVLLYWHDTCSINFRLTDVSKLFGDVWEYSGMFQDFQRYRRISEDVKLLPIIFWDVYRDIFEKRDVWCTNLAQRFTPR